MIHSNVQTLSCDVCQKKFSRRDNLKTHMLTHTGVRQFECSICKKCFAYKHVLKNHMAVHLNNN